MLTAKGSARTPLGPTRKDRVLTRCFRIQAQVINVCNKKILWINTYLPTDPQTIEAFDPTALNEVLVEVETIINSVSHTEIVWAGDLNWDPGRNSMFSRIMREFLEKIGLVSLWNHHPVDFTHMHTDNKSISTVDHFLIS